MDSSLLRSWIPFHHIFSKFSLFVVVGSFDSHTFIWACRKGLAYQHNMILDLLAWVMAFVTIQQKRNVQNALLLCVIRFISEHSEPSRTCSRMEKWEYFYRIIWAAVVRLRPSGSLSVGAQWTLDIMCSSWRRTCHPFSVRLHPLREQTNAFGRTKWWMTLRTFA